MPPRARLLPILVAVSLASSSAASAQPAADAARGGDRPLIAVLPFVGPQAMQAEATVVRTVRTRATLLPASTWARSAQKLFATTHTPEDIAAVAQDVGARMVITGTVRREGRAWLLAISFRNGADGRSKAKLHYPLRGPRVSAATLRQLAVEADRQFDMVLSIIDDEAAAGTTPPPPGSPRPPTPGSPRPPPRATPPVAQANPPPSKGNGNGNGNGNGGNGNVVGANGNGSGGNGNAGSNGNAGGNGSNGNAGATANGATGSAGSVSRVEARPARPRWAPWFDLDAGFLLTWRQFRFDPISQPSFSSAPAGGIEVSGAVFPLAFTWDKLGGVFAGLGLGATVDKPFWANANAKGSDGTAVKVPTAELRVEGGLRWNIVLYKPMPRPQLLVDVGGGVHSFAFGKDAMTGNDLGPADVSYKYFTIGGGLRIHFAERVYLWALFNYHYVFNAGGIQDVQYEYGPAHGFGVRIKGGLAIFAWKGLRIGIDGYYERFSLTFQDVTPPAAKAANSALDQYFGGVLSLGYVL